MTDLLTGQVRSVRFKAEDTGYVILAFDPHDEFDTITIVGTMPDVQQGVDVELKGDWIEHPKYGRQFKFDRYKFPQPSSKEGVIAYLSTLKGVKESLARRIYEKFGDAVFDLLDNNPDQLIEVRGVGPKTLPKMIKSYQNSRELRTIIEFLQELGVSAGYASRIWKEFGDAAVGEIKKDPYKLCDRVRGFGFKRADEVALGLGIGAVSKTRLAAGIKYVLKEAASFNGHCYLPTDELLTKAAALLKLPGVAIQSSDVAAVCQKMQTIIQERDRVYLDKYWKAEHELADAIVAQCGALPHDQGLNLWLDKYDLTNAFPLGSDQRKAVQMVAQSQLSIITGGAGVGKSSVAKAIIEYWDSQGKKIVSCAPTGKAAQRIKEATGVSASTIHRLLGWTGHGFEKDGENPIECDAILIDETSMPNLELMNSLFRAIPAHASVLMIGDPNQLPCIGAGNVLKDAIESGLLPVKELTQVFRQSGDSRIIQVSHDINAGRFPCFQRVSRNTEIVTDALWVACDQAKIPVAIQWLLRECLPTMGIPNSDIQLLSPQHRGDAGNIALNQMVQDIWNPKPVQELSGWRLNDRVIQTSNDYDKGVFNGDIGVIEGINTEDKEFTIRYPCSESPDGKAVVYASGEMSDVMLAYSISVHKSQGSEFPVVVIPATMQHYMMLKRNLYYTAVTRGKKLVIMVGEEKAIQVAVKTQTSDSRNTTLVDRLYQQLKG